MNKNLLASALLVACPLASYAADAPLTLTFNAGVASDYRYRGISQSRLRPAAQVGADLGLANGLYLGTWASTIKWVKDAGGDGNVEIDLYGGYKNTIGKSGIGYDVGYLRYQYPSNKLSPSANTSEVYGALSYGPATLKYSHATTNLFGFANSKHSGYLDLSANFTTPWCGVVLTPHIGHQTVRGHGDFSYTDYSVAVSKDFNGLVPSLAIVRANTHEYLSPAGHNLGRTGVVAMVKYTF